MPAYFGTDITFLRKDITPHFMREFQDALEYAGLRFQSGYWSSEQDSLDTILAWNQEHIASDFCLGPSEHHSHDYKQMTFQYDAFKKDILKTIRGFWMNRYPSGEEFAFSIIIPEYEMIGEEALTADVEFLPDQIGAVEQLARSLWQSFPRIQTVQTNLELTGGCVPLSKIMHGERVPSSYPFAIIPVQAADQYPGRKSEQVDHRGILLWNSSRNSP